MAQPPAKIKIKTPRLGGSGLYKRLKGLGDTGIDVEKEALRRKFVGLKESK